MKLKQTVNSKKIILLILFLLFILLFSKNVNAESLSNDVEVEPETELTYYLDVTYDGVDNDGTQSNDSTNAKVLSSDVVVEDKIPDGMEFVGFVTTQNGTIGATLRSNGEACTGNVYDDTKEAEVDSGTWNSAHTEYYYHGLHYSEADRTVRFKVKNLKAGGVVKVGIIVRTPTVDDPSTQEVEDRRDFYNIASATENALRMLSNTVHVFMGSQNTTLYDVKYQYTGTLPENNVPALPDTTSYAEGASVGVAAAPEIEGYTFSGWEGKTESSNTNVNVDATGTFTMPNENVVFTGSFTKINNKYKVTYQITGDKPEDYVVPIEKEYFEGTTVKVDSLKAGDRVGNYTFSGWSTNDATITQDDANNNQFVIGNSNVVLKGSFTKIKHNVEYRFFDTVLPPNSDSYLPATQSYGVGDKVTTATGVAQTEPTGYKFLGWYKEASFTMPDEDVVIYGEWGREYGKIKFDIKKEVVDKQVAYRVGDEVQFKITVKNTNNYELTDVVVKENYTKVNDGTPKTNDTKAVFVDGTGYVKETNEYAKISSLPANQSVEIFAKYTVIEDDERVGNLATVTNEVEIVRAIDAVNHSTLDAGEYKATADFNVVTSYRISGEVKKHNEERTNSTTNLKETVEVTGGTISNDYNTIKAQDENKTYFEYVNENASSNIQTITVTPDENHIVKKISLVSSKKDGTDAVTNVIYGEGAVTTAELKYTLNNDGTITLKPSASEQTKLFANVTNDKNIIAEFEAKKGKVTVHHMINSSEPGVNPTEHSFVEKEDLVGEPYITESITIHNYKLVNTSDNTTGKYKVGTFENGAYVENNIDVYYYYDVDEREVGELDYTVHYFYNGVEDESKKEQKHAQYKAEITTFTDKSAGHTFIEARAMSATGDLKEAPLTQNPLIVGMDVSKNVINVYYKTAYTITGKVKDNVGGTATNGSGNPALETVLYGENSKEKIVMTPNSGYDPMSLVIYTYNADNTKTEESLDINSFKNANGVITIPVGYFENVTTNKEVVVEFKKKTSVIVKYLEKTTEAEKAQQVTIPGHEGDEYTPEPAVIDGYRQAQIVANDGSKSNITFENKDKFDLSATNKMGNDTITVVFWYEPIPEGTVTIKHIEIDEADIKNGLTLTSGTVVKEETFSGKNGKLIDSTRKEFTDDVTGRKDISANGPTSTNPKLIVVGKDENSYTVTLTENSEGKIEPVEIRYYYEKQYNITTDIKEHTETIDGTQKSVKGGNISGEDENPYETVNKAGKNDKTIVITPDINYKVKSVKVNGNIISVEGFEDSNKVVTLPKGYFSNINEDKKVEVEFEKIPAKVIVKFLLNSDNSELVDSTKKLGLVGDTYNEGPKEIKGYNLVQTKLPTNNKGTMTEKDIVVNYYYEKIEEKPEIPEKKEEPKEEPKKETKEEPKNEPKEEPKKENKEEPKTQKESKIVMESKENPNPVTEEKVVTENKETPKKANEEKFITEVENKTTNNPKTNDDINIHFITFIITTCVYIKCKKKNKKKYIRRR